MRSLGWGGGPYDLIARIRMGGRIGHYVAGYGVPYTWDLLIQSLSLGFPVYSGTFIGAEPHFPYGVDVLHD